MPEKKLWKFLADLWDKATVLNGVNLPKPTHHVVPVPGDQSLSEHMPCFGLCRCLVRMRDGHKITEQVFSTADNRLHEYLSDNFWTGGYLYDLNAGGAKQRAALCRMMANQCD